MQLSAHECYGFQVACRAHGAAVPVVERFFGPGRDLGAAGRPGRPAGSRLRVSLEVAEQDRPPPAATLPYFPAGWERADPIVIDLGRSRAEDSPAGGAIRVRLHRGDLDDPIVWGRWLLEKSFLLTALRSARQYGLHAGAVTVRGRPVLVAAASGVGKSTFVGWAVRQGAAFTGDDAMIRHHGDPPGVLWGYPRAAYLGPEALAGWSGLDGAVKCPVPGREKLRVEWPPATAPRLASRVRAGALVFLTREHRGVRRLAVREAADRCREDYLAGKTARADRGWVERDAVAQFTGMSLVELGLSADLDRNLSVLTDLLEGGADAG